MLTGESIPVTKTPIPFKVIENQEKSNNEVEFCDKYPGSILYGGTKIKYCMKDESIGVCYRTGFRSAKGKLIASLLNPIQGFLGFFYDMLLIILAIFIIATIAFIFQAIDIRAAGGSYGSIAIVYGNDLTVAIPVTLVVTLIAATYISIYR